MLFLHSCRTDEIVAKQDNISTEKIGAFVNYENLLTKEKTTSRGSDSVSENYGVPFSILLSNYMDKHPEYASEFQKLLGDIDLGICSQTYGNSDKTVVFPVLNNGFVTNILACNVNLERDYVKFRMLDATNSEVINAMNIFQSRIKRAHQAREIEIEPIELQWTGGSSDFPFSWIFTTGGGGTSGGMDGGSNVHGSGSGGGGGGTTTPPTNDPCAKAKAGTDKATATSKTGAYDTSKTAIKTAAASNGNENAVVLGKDANGYTISGNVQTVGATGGKVTVDVANPTAEMHTHPSENPPSPGDFYGLMESNGSFPGFISSFVITQDGTEYALVVTDPAALHAFLQNYPHDQYIKPNSGDWNTTTQLYVDYDAALNRLKNFSPFMLQKDAMGAAMAYVADKYKMGVALTKKDATTGNFKAINSTKNSDGSYSSSTCNN